MELAKGLIAIGAGLCMGIGAIGPRLSAKAMPSVKRWRAWPVSPTRPERCVPT